MENKSSDRISGKDHQPDYKSSPLKSKSPAQHKSLGLEQSSMIPPESASPSTSVSSLFFNKNQPHTHQTEIRAGNIKEGFSQNTLLTTKGSSHWTESMDQDSTIKRRLPPSSEPSKHSLNQEKFNS
ncbi:hypothetical protein [Endozoicomonas atrinae]|uniref:hypothetical protein n=1 Tax=Endozoicomonas atrinae TaxID=1333660 RepID=UPI003B003D43